MTNPSIFSNPDPAWLPESELPVPRDAQERPMIVPPGGTEPVPYERVSRVSSSVDTLQWLRNWRLGLLARGMAISPDLCQMASAYEWKDPRMQDIINTAHDRAGGNAKANWGTAVHAHTEPGAHPESVPEEMRYDVASYHLAMEEARCRVVESEVFVVNDDLRVAGTLDTLAEDETLGPHVQDKKTGKYAAMTCAIQLAIYANSRRVDLDLVAAGKESPRYTLDVNLERGVVAHIPREGGSTTLKKVDIARGYALARLAMEVKAHQDYAGWTDPEPLGKATRKETLRAAIEAAPSRTALRAIKANADRWLTKADRERMNARWVELGPEGVTQ